MRGHVARITLRRPERLNAIDAAVNRELVEAVERLDADPEARVAILAGEGRAFCAGLDFGSFQKMAESGDDEPRPQVGAEARPAGRITNFGQQAAYVWAEIPVPVIAAVHGVALGGGAQIAIAADLRIVAPDAQISILEIRWGLVPDMTGTQLLPRLVGIDRAKELAFTGRMVTGTEAVQIGLATRVSDNPRDDALALAREIASKSPQAVRGAKALLDLAGRVPLEEGFKAEERTINSLIGSPDQVEAVTAYFEKRDPVFRG
jgi:enoyl-CoA hydratase/carnithine racemase